MKLEREGKDYEQEERGERKYSDSRFKRRFLNRGFHDGLGQLATFATLGTNTELPAHIGKRAGATSDRFPDLAVGYSFAEAYVHGGSLDKLGW